MQDCAQHWLAYSQAQQLITTKFKINQNKKQSILWSGMLKSLKVALLCSG